MTTKLPIDPNHLPVNTGNLYPPVLLTGLTNDVEYTVTIIAHLADGTTITESRTVKPHTDPAPNPPTILTKNGLGLTGTGIPGYSIKLYDSNGVLVTEVEIDSNGNWSIPTALFPGGTTVGFTGSLTVTDINGNESSPTMIDSIDSIPPTSPTNITANGSGLSGTAEPGATVYLLDANGYIITSVLVDSTGHWFIPAASFPNGVVSPFTGSIKVVDPAGNESAIVNINLNVDITPPFAPIPTVQNATGLNGIAEAGSTVNLLDSSGNIIASVVADNSGFWTIPASSFPNGATNGFNGSIVSVDAAGNISKPTTIHSIDGVAPNAPVITTANASKLSGTAEANTTIKLYNSSSVLVATTITDPLGNWIFTPDKFPGGATDGFTGTVTASDIALNESTETPVPTIDGLAPNPPVITIANASGLFGTAEPNAVIRMYNSLGILVNGTIADNSGNWSILPTRFPGNVTNGFTGYLTQTDLADNTSNQTTIPVIDGIAPNAPLYSVANYYGINGTAEPGSRISLKDSTGIEVATTYTDMNGNWTIPANSFPGQATNEFTGSVTAIDLAGNESIGTPVSPINGVLPTANLTDYTDNVGNIQSNTSTAATTDDTTPGINIGAGVLDTPKLYIGGVLTAAIYDSVIGTLTPIVALTDGTYDFTYTLTDSIGNISLPSPVLTITVDTVAPTTPSAPTTYDDNVGSIQSATSTAATTDDTTPGINIGASLTDTPNLYINDALVTSTYNATSGTLTPNTPLTQGTYSFSYTLTDAAGNESAKSPTYSIVVDLTPPATPAAPTTYVDNVGTITSNTSVAPETDDTTPGINIGTDLINTPKLYVGGVLTASTYDPITGTLTPNTALVEGVNVITYTLTDAAGNESGQSPSITITVNTTPPTTSAIASYVDNVGSIQSTTSVAISTDDTTPGLNVGTGLTTIPKLYIDGILTAATYNSIIGTLTPTVALAQGTYSFTYTLTDVVGNESLPSAAFSITIDTTAPTTPVTAITSYVDNVGSIQSATSTAIITDDTTPGINIGTGLTDTVTLYINDSAVVSTYDSVAGTLTPFYTLAEGTYKFSYTLTDSVGNESGQSPSITITIDITPPTTPLNKPTSYIDNVGSIQSTTSNAAITDDTTPGINIGAGLTNTPKLYVNGTYTAATYVSGTGIITPNSPLSDGLKTITYTLSDVAGNESGQSPAITLTIDTVAPTVSTPTTFLDNVGPYQFTNSTLSITDDNRPGINIGTGLSDTVKLYVDGNLTPASYDSSAGTLTPTLAVSEGTHTFAYTLTDTAGNESALSGSLTLTIDTVAPSIPSAPTSYTDNTGSIQSTTSIAATTDDTTPGINVGSGLIDVPTLYINGVLTAAIYDSVAGTLTPVVALTEGTYNFTYTLRDAAGNESGQSPALTITIDTTAPTINSVTSSWGSVLDSVESGSDGTITVATSGVEDGQTLTATINSVQYTGTVSSNSVILTVPSADLSVLYSGTTYTISVSVSDLAGNNTSNTSTTFTSTRPPQPGASLGGGYYAGNIVDGGVIYVLIVAPKASGESLLKWGPGTYPTPGSEINGPANSEEEAALGVSYEAATFCEGLTIGGYSDWYLPSKNELEVLYYNLKPDTTANNISSGSNANAVSPEPVSTNYTSDSPAQTSAGIGFRIGETNAFELASYWSSTSAYVWGDPWGFVWAQYFSAGVQYQTSKTGTGYVRAVRREALPATVPDQPTGITATAGDSSATVSFTAPYNGNSAITGYTVTAYVSGVSTGITATGSTSPINITGLTNGTAYTFTVKATNAIGTGLESSPSNEITPVVPTVGGAYGGGYYAGNIVDGGVAYRLIVAPKASGESSDMLKWSLMSTPTETQTLTNGLAASNAMNSSTYPAAYYCKGLNIGGYTDWYLPARDELEILYRNFKPTADINFNYIGGRIGTGFGCDGLAIGTNSNSNPPGAAYTYENPSLTGILAFQHPMVECFSYAYAYWSSTMCEEYTSAWAQSFLDGEQGPHDVTKLRFVRAIRREALPVSVPYQPTGITAAASDSSAIVWFTVPYDGSSAITGYTVTAYISGVSTGITATGSTSPINITGLSNGTAYTFTVKATNAIGTGLESVASNEITPDVLTVGGVYGGGYYAGNIVDGGVTYRLIVAPKASGETDVIWKTSNSTAPIDTRTLTNGLAASNAMNSSTYPAAYYCKGLNIGGFTDWYLPARDELEILYRSLKPGTSDNFVADPWRTVVNFDSGFGLDTGANGYNANSSPIGAGYSSGSPAQTGVAVFKTRSVEAFRETVYWCSTTLNSDHTWFQNFVDGRQFTSLMVQTMYVRAVRRVPL